MSVKKIFLVSIISLFFFNLTSYAKSGIVDIIKQEFIRYGSSKAIELFDYYLNQKLSSSSSSFSSTSSIRDFSKNLFGIINNDPKYIFHMSLQKSGSNLSGNYYYDKIGINIKLIGSIDDSNNILLSEYYKGKKTGIWKGKMFNENVVEGIWSSPDYKRNLEFKIISE